MTLAEELSKLEELHQRGSLTDTEFAQAKARLLRGEPTAALAHRVNALNGLRRSPDDRWIGGVCGGLALFSGLDGWIWRLVFVLSLLLGGLGLVIYLLLWLLVPLDSTLPRLTAPTER